MTDPDAPYTIHKNGGGRVGRFVTISPHIFVDENSVIDGHCELYGDEDTAPAIQNSHLSGWCMITHGHIANSRLDGFVRVDGFDIKDSYLSGDILIHDSYVEGCHLEAPAGQQIRIVEGSKLYQNSCYGPIFVSNSKMQACEILPLSRVLGGFWSVSPKIRRTGTQFQLCATEDGRILIGCLTKTVGQWKELVALWTRWQKVKIEPHSPAAQFAPLADFEGFSADEINAIATAIEQW